MENNNTVQNVVHGFKVFRPDWTCSPNGNTKQYTCPGKFEEEGNLMFAVTVCTSVRPLLTASIIMILTATTRLQKSLHTVKC